MLGLIDQFRANVLQHSTAAINLGDCKLAREIIRVKKIKQLQKQELIKTKLMNSEALINGVTQGKPTYDSRFIKIMKHKMKNEDKLFQIKFKLMRLNLNEHRLDLLGAQKRSLIELDELTTTSELSDPNSENSTSTQKSNSTSTQRSKTDSLETRGVAGYPWGNDALLF